jgi:hypothetical protein
MRNRKFIIYLLVIVLLPFSFVSCGKQTITTTTAKVAEVTATNINTTTTVNDTGTTLAKGMWDEDNLEERTRTIVGLDETTQTSTTIQEDTSGKLLNLLNYHDSRAYDYITVEGEVKNISNQKLENVLVVVIFYDKDSNLITTAEAVIQYNPIMPDQTSPFTAMATDNPLITKYAVTFQFMFGGQISTTNSQHK